MPFLSYAQNFEDVILWRALQHVGTGTYIDIGGQDPVVDSVSKAFSLRGWRGIHVEASPIYAEALRLDRPNDKVIEAAVGTATAPITLYFIPGTGLSTGVADIAEHHQASGYEIQPITVQVVPLSQVLNYFSSEDVHWLKIDVEGMEADVLASWGSSKVRPWVLVIESTYPNSQKPTQNQWMDRVKSLGYHEVYFDGLSRYFVSNKHPELDEFFFAPPNVFDGFSVASHHFSAREFALEHQQQHARIEQAAHEIENAYNQVTSANEELIKENKGFRESLRGAQNDIEQYRTWLWSARDEQERLVNSISDSNNSWLAQLEIANAQIKSLSAEKKAEKQNAVLLEKTLGIERQLLSDLRREGHDKILSLSLERERALVVLDERKTFWNEQFRDIKERLEAAQITISGLEQSLQEERNEAAAQRDFTQAKIAELHDRTNADTQLLSDLRREGHNKILNLSLERERALVILDERKAVWNEQFRDMKERLEAAQITISGLEQSLQGERSEAAAQRNIAEARIAELHDRADVDAQLLSSLRDIVALAPRQLAEAAMRHEAQVMDLNVSFSDALGVKDALISEWEEKHHFLGIALAAEIEAQEKLTADHQMLLSDGLILRSNLEKKEASLLHLEKKRQFLEAERSRLVEQMTGLSQAITDASIWQDRLKIALANRRKKGFWRNVKTALLHFGNDDFSRLENDISTARSTTYFVAESEMTPEHKGGPLTENFSEDYSRPAGSVNEICLFDDEQFVFCAFLSILGRSPDSEGAVHYLKRVRAGWSKLSIITQLAISVEGRAYGSDIEGLHSLIHREKWRKTPIIKWFVQDQENLPYERQQRVLESKISMLALQLNAINKIVVSQQERSLQDNVLSNIMANIGAINEKISTSNRDIALIKESIPNIENETIHIRKFINDNLNIISEKSNNIFDIIKSENKMTIEEIVRIAH